MFRYWKWPTLWVPPDNPFGVHAAAVQRSSLEVDKILGRTGSRGGVIQVGAWHWVRTSILVRVGWKLEILSRSFDNLNRPTLYRTCRWQNGFLMFLELLVYSTCPCAECPMDTFQAWLGSMETGIDYSLLSSTSRRLFPTFWGSKCVSCPDYIKHQTHIDPPANKPGFECSNCNLSRKAFGQMWSRIWLKLVANRIKKFVWRKMQLIWSLKMMISVPLQSECLKISTRYKPVLLLIER